MKKTERIQQILDTLYPNPPIPLHHTSPFTFLVAVMLSAQCQDARVNQVTPHLFAKASTPEAMASLSFQEIVTCIASLGLKNTKAKALQDMSCQLLTRHAGEVPNTFEALEALSGVGHKTASVVLSQCFGLETFPVDTHIHRLAKRWGLSSGKNVVTTEKDLKELFPKSKWRDLHLQMIYFGREYCCAKKHVWQTCPICSWIHAKNRG